MDVISVKDLSQHTNQVLSRAAQGTVLIEGGSVALVPQPELDRLRDDQEMLYHTELAELAEESSRPLVGSRERVEAMRQRLRQQ